MTLHAVIMAGGTGTRFWPASRRLRPKQLLRLAGDRSMLQSTVDRLGDLVAADEILVVTNRDLIEAVAEQLPQLPPGRVLGEPCKRDTAPCIGLAAAILHHRDPDAMMLALPADHVIGTEAQFQAAVRQGVRLIEDDPRRIVTFGIRPSYPAESFGYIERGAAIARGVGEEANSSGEAAAFNVQRFREKPDRETAQAYLEAGTFYWNSGIFLWSVETILDALRRLEPAMAERLERIGAASDSERFAEVLEREFAEIEGKSIDYAVMEHYEPVAVIEAPFAWDDVGSWQALSRLNPPDAAGNTVQGRHVGIDTRGSIIRGEGDHVIVTIGVEDLIVVQTPEATLVAAKGAEERLREAVRRLQAEGLEQLL